MARLSSFATESMTLWFPRERSITVVVVTVAAVFTQTDIFTYLRLCQMANSAVTYCHYLNCYTASSYTLCSEKNSHFCFLA